MRTPALLCLLLAGCVTANSSDATFKAALVGHRFDKFILDHGIPQTRTNLSDGRVVAEWSDNYGIADTGAPVQTLIMLGSNAEVQGRSYQLSCKLRIVVSKAGIIEDVSVVNDTIGKWQLSRCDEVFRG